jgi:hypothetical protein
MPVFSIELFTCRLKKSQRISLSQLLILMLPRLVRAAKILISSFIRLFADLISSFLQIIQYGSHLLVVFMLSLVGRRIGQSEIGKEIRSKGQVTDQAKFLK